MDSNSNWCQVFGRFENLNNFTILVKQKFGEIPLNLFTFIWLGVPHLRVGSQPTVNRMGVFSVDINFLKNREFHVVVLVHKLLYIFLSSRLLTLELIARESKYLKSLVFKFLSDLIQLLVIRIRISTKTCHINHKQSLVIFEFRK